MLSFSALVAIVGLAGVSKADDGDGAYVGDFSMWNGGQCGKAPGNPIGMWSINKALTESCHLFKHTDENPVRSVLLNFMGEGHTCELTPVAVDPSSGPVPSRCHPAIHLSQSIPPLLAHRSEMIFRSCAWGVTKSLLTGFISIVTVYTSEDCSEGADVVPVGECASSEEGYASFSVSTGN